MDVIKVVKKAQRGNVKAFERLVVFHQVLMYRVAKSILHRDEDCADAIQEAILKAYQSIRTLREPKYFKTWLLRIVMNECHQIHRQRKNLFTLEKCAEPASIEKAFVQIEVEELLDSLPEDQSHLLKLFHIEDISIKDLADIFQVPENTIKTRLRRAREKAREILTMEEDYQWKNGNMN